MILEKTDKLQRTNQYITLAHTLPQYLFSCRKQKPSDSEIEAIKKVLGSRSVMLELGSGSGQHLVEQAASHPDKTFVGIEIRYKRIYKTAEKAQKKNLTNLFLIRVDAEYIESIFEPNKIEKIFINFPDPWDRRRWKKHRLTAPEYLDRYKNLLSPNGVIYFKTDHQGLFDDTLKILETRTDYSITFTSRDLQHSERAQTNIVTEFEQLFKSKGMSIFAVEFQKV